MIDHVYLLSPTLRTVAQCLTRTLCAFQFASWQHLRLSHELREGDAVKTGLALVPFSLRLTAPSYVLHLYIVLLVHGDPKCSTNPVGNLRKTKVCFPQAIVLDDSFLVALDPLAHQAEAVPTHLGQPTKAGVLSYLKVPDKHFAQRMARGKA